MLQSAQPYPGDESIGDDGFSEGHFFLYTVSDTEYVLMDHQRDEELTILIESLYNPDFMPALWYPQVCSEAMGLDPEYISVDECYLEEMGDVEVSAVKLLLDQYLCQSSRGSDELDAHNVWAEGDVLKITVYNRCICLELPKKLLKNSNFDLEAWYNNAIDNYSTVCESEDWTISEELDLAYSSDDKSYSLMPMLHPVTPSECDESDDSTPPPSLWTVSDSSESDSSEDDNPLDKYGDLYEALEEHLCRYASAAAAAQARPSSDSEITPQAHRLGDVLGNTISVLLEFF